MKRLSLILLVVLASVSAWGQNVSNDASVIKRNGIKSLTITNCIGNEGCFSEYYEFNACGEISLEIPPMVNSFAKMEYDKNCRLSVIWVMNHSPKTDSIWRKAVYNYSDKDSILVANYYYENNKLTEKTDSYKISKVKAEPKDAVKDKQGRIIQHSQGDLNYPCGIHYKGSHTFKYTYNKNGLIAKAMVYNSKNELVVNLEYEYKK